MAEDAQPRWDLVSLADASSSVLAEVLALNRAVEEMTSPLTPARLAQLIGWADYAVAATGPDGRVAGFLIGYGPGAAYDSVNYRWFEERGAPFAYVDRVVVGEAARGRGLARRLYAGFADHARARGLGPLCCEVNSLPPNPGSDAFHLSLGFQPVGEAETGPGKRVRYLMQAKATA